MACANPRCEMWGRDAYGQDIVGQGNVGDVLRRICNGVVQSQN